MPIYEQTYRNFDGAYVRRFRWLLVARQELRVLMKFRVFLLLLLVAELHVILRVLQIVGTDVIAEDPNHSLHALVDQLTWFTIDAQMFFEFLQFQAPVVFIMFLYAGSGMICNDFRNNLMEVYFSKPLVWYDYALGKILSLVFVGLIMTAIPGVILVVLHNALMPGMNTFLASWWWPFSIVAFSLAYVLPGALFILGCSALISSQGYTAITVFMVLIVNSAMTVLLAQLIRDRSYLILSYPAALRRFGEACFQTPAPFFNVDWRWALAYLGAVCVWGAWVVFRKSRRAEVA